MRLMRFCRPGTFSSGISTPRSPRATMKASATSMISSSREIACGFSILASTSARPPATFLTSATSSARCTKETAIQSTPASSPASRSMRSFGVIEATGISVSGRLTPLRFETRPPMSTKATARFGDASVICRRTLPSSISTTWPSCSACKISGCGKCTRVASPGVVSESKMKLSPRFNSTAPSLKRPMRSFGPCRSSRIAIGRPNSCSSERMICTRSRMSSWLAWLMLMRNTSAPARNRSAMAARWAVAGPKVATILLRRSRRIV